MSRLQEHLAELIVDDLQNVGVNPPGDRAHYEWYALQVAERLASAFQQVGYRCYMHAEFGDIKYQRCRGSADSADKCGWVPVYRFARPESSEETA